MSQVTRIGVIGGSGLYEMEGLTDIREETLETPFGSPSAPYLIGRLEGHDGVESWSSCPVMAETTSSTPQR